MLRRQVLVLLILLLMVGGCRQEEQASTSTAASDAAAETAAAPETPPEIRKTLDQIQPAIPLWTGARATSDSVRRQGSSTVIDLWTNDSFPMVWHYYVTYLAQYRAWEPLDPYPDRTDEGRSLQLDLNEVMRDPFVPDTSLDPGDPHVILMIREDVSRNRVNIRYVIEPPEPVATSEPEPEQ